MAESESVGVIRIPSIHAGIGNGLNQHRSRRIGMNQNSSHSGRSGPIEVATILRKAGYETLRTIGSNLFDLVAWKDGKILFLVVRRSRKAGITRWAKEVFRLVDLVRAGTIPGDIHFWVCRSGVWSRYQIMPGGSVPVELEG